MIFKRNQLGPFIVTKKPCCCCHEPKRVCNQTTTSSNQPLKLNWTPILLSCFIFTFRNASRCTESYRSSIQKIQLLSILMLIPDISRITRAGRLHGEHARSAQWISRFGCFPFILKFSGRLAFVLYKSVFSWRRWIIRLGFFRRHVRIVSYMVCYMTKYGHEICPEPVNDVFSIALESLQAGRDTFLYWWCYLLMKQEAVVQTWYTWNLLVDYVSPWIWFLSHGLYSNVPGQPVRFNCLLAMVESSFV